MTVLKYLIGISLMCFSLQTLSFPGIENFVGLYQYKSGPTEYTSCADSKIKLNDEEDGLEVYYAHGNYHYTTYDFPAVNKGKIPWEYDWGDGVAKGNQKTTFDGHMLKNIVHIKWRFLKIGEMLTTMNFENHNLLKITHRSAERDITCYLTKIK
jgi:hypothetical protein